MCELKKYHKTSNTRIDKCMIERIKKLKKKGIEVISCCCGHGKYPTTIIIRHGKIAYDIISKKVIPRTRRFYKKDREGYYYIPEVVKGMSKKNERR